MISQGVTVCAKAEVREGFVERIDGEIVLLEEVA
jgi:hypothetical protein